MRSTRSSITQAISLKPEVEFEVLKLILLRERYLVRLKDKLDKCNGKIDVSIIGAFDTLRDATIETVETIEMWERTQVCPLCINNYLVTPTYSMDVNATGDLSCS